MVIDRLLEESEHLLQRRARIMNAYSASNAHNDAETSKHLREMDDFCRRVPIIENVITREDLIVAELGRFMDRILRRDIDTINPEGITLSDALLFYGIEESELSGLREWLIGNKENYLIAQQELVDGHDTGLHRPIRVEVPAHVRAAEEALSAHVARYREALKMIPPLSDCPDALDDLQILGTLHPRESDFSRDMNSLFISLPMTTYVAGGKIQLNEGQLLFLLGHECLGHALTDARTQRADIPAFLKEPTEHSITCNEAVAQFYQHRVFEDIYRSPDVQKALGINNFEKIYRRQKAQNIKNYFERKLAHYMIHVLGSAGNLAEKDVLEKAETLIEEVVPYQRKIDLARTTKSIGINQNGRMSFEGFRDLTYASHAVERALQIFREAGIEYEEPHRSLIDKTLLTGYWTPKGFIENARLVAKEHQQI